ncbi:MAG: hypothetical protein QM627_08950 [Luteolibacter sp.]
MPSPQETLVIKDSSVVIDLVNAGLFQVWFALGIRTMTTDFVESELRNGAQWAEVAPLIAEGLLTVESFGTAEVLQLVQLSKEHKISNPDGSVLYLSQQKSAILLTGDRKLRKACTALGIECRGTLWVIDRLLTANVIACPRATAALRLLISNGARLPEDEVVSRLKLWAPDGNA